MSDEPQITSIVSRHSRIRSINNERALHNFGSVERRDLSSCRFVIRARPAPGDL